MVPEILLKMVAVLHDFPRSFPSLGGSGPQTVAFFFINASLEKLHFPFTYSSFNPCLS